MYMLQYINLLIHNNDPKIQAYKYQEFRDTDAEGNVYTFSAMKKSCSLDYYTIDGKSTHFLDELLD